VSKTLTDEDGDLGTTGDQVVTYYSYDPHGNVTWLVQRLPASAESLTELVVCVEYEYDLVSGKVTQVAVQPGRRDQFVHRYEYDHDQRIVAVYTSRDLVIWERDASYSYYPHGPLERLEMGTDSVQGLDYAYTINGWLKAINYPSLHPSDDKGADGATTGANPSYARDAWGMMLHYHADDFSKGTSQYDDGVGTWHLSNLSDLFNGNIAGWSWNSRRSNGATDTALGSRYRYDLVNRIRTDTVSLRGATSWQAPSTNWSSFYTYDGNGNIKTLYRADASGSMIDSLAYTYTANTNRLTHIDEQPHNDGTGPARPEC